MGERGAFRLPMRWGWLWVCASWAPRGAGAYSALALPSPTPPSPSASSERRLSGVTFTADITVSGDSYSNEMGFELNCNDGVHHIGYAQESGGFYGGWKSDRPNREHLRANRQHNIGPWLANVVFEQYAFCEVDIWDAYGDGWNGGVLTINLPVPKTYSMPCPSDMACNTQYKGPLRFTFLVDLSLIHI